MHRARLLCVALACGIFVLTGPGAFAQTTATKNTLAPPDLGTASPAPPYLPLNPLPSKGFRPQLQTITGGFSVNTDSREEVRSFYDGIFPTSDNAPQDSTADVSGCHPGHNSNAFQQAELRRINWYRAMAGMPASIMLDPIDNWGSQQMAIIESENNVLDHHPTNTYTCYNTFAASYAGGDQSLGADGAQATVGFMWDYGAKNNEVGHRRWILYPPETVMGVGDVPGTPGHAAANLTYVFDPASFGARPATRQPYVSWPPEGFAPYQVVYPYWSFGLSNADLSAATITMTSNGVPVTTTIQPYQTGFGENTLVWVPMGLDATTGGTSFPFSGTDTVYSVIVSNINYSGTNISYAYHVTVFDPAVPGADYIPCSLAGPTKVVAGVTSTFGATAPNNAHVTSYNFLTAQLGSGNLFDDASGGLVNFTLMPGPNYTVTTTEPFGSGTCFNLEHADTNSSPQLFQLDETLLPGTNTILSFQSMIGYAYTNEVARVQVSADGGANWKDIFTEPGCNDPDGTNVSVCEYTFTPYTLSLSNYAGMTVLLRFNFDFQSGSYISGGFPIGWFFTDILITNTMALTNQTIYNSSVTNIVSGNLADSANNGLGNFTISPPPYYYAITNPPVGSEPACFHLTHLDSASQLMQLNEVLVPSAGSTVSFSSQLGYATSDETARVQVSTNSGLTWDDLWVEAGGNNTPESSFTPQTLSLGAYAGMLTWLRFNFAFTGGSYYPQSDNYIGWNIEDIVVTNVQQQQITVLDTTNFAFVPAQPGTYLLQAQPVIFNQFPLTFGPVKTVTVVANNTPVIVMNQPLLTNEQVWLNFTVTGGVTNVFQLLQTTQLNVPWITNIAAVLTTNVIGSSYRYAATNNAPVEFYRIRVPQ